MSKPDARCPECGAAEPDWDGRHADPDSLRTEIERLRAALKPFAEIAESFDADGRELKDSDGIYANTAGDFRRARVALNQQGRDAK